MELQIKALSPDVPVGLYGTFNKPGDSGLDLHTLHTITVEPGKIGKIEFGISCSGGGKSYWLLPRSSIVKTPLRMANSMGLIDSGYRGPIMAVVDNISDEPYVVEAGTRLFQLAAGDLGPVTFRFVDELDATERGEGGFGSTGK